MAIDRFDLTGRSALVTGGSKGLGQALAHALALAGADVVIAARHAGELETGLAAVLEGTRARGAWLVADLAERTAAVRLASAAVEAFGKIDILVNNAGINILAPSSKWPIPTGTAFWR